MADLTGIARGGGPRILLAVGTLAVGLLFAGDRVGMPRVQALGAAGLGFLLVVVGVASFRARYFEVGVEPGSLQSSSRFVFRGPGAIAWGLLCVTLGAAALAGAAVVLLGLQETAERLIAERPGIVIAPTGFLFLCAAGGWLAGEETMNSSPLLFLATLPQRIGGLITVLFSLAVLGMGLFELVAPAAFDRIVESLKPPQTTSQYSAARAQRCSSLRTLISPP